MTEFDDRDLLIEYLNGHLGETRARALEERLAADATLREALDFERRLQGALRSSPAFVRSRLRSDAAQAGARRPRWLPVLVPTCAALILAVILGVGSETPSAPATEFRTLTDPERPDGCAELTVVARDEAALLALTEALEGSVQRVDRGTLSLVLAVDGPTGRAALSSRLGTDARVRMILDRCGEPG